MASLYSLVEVPVYFHRVRNVIIVLSIACGPARPSDGDSEPTSSGTAMSSEVPTTDVPTEAECNGESSTTAETDTMAEAAIKQCESAIDKTTCEATSIPQGRCNWFKAQKFEQCEAECDKVIVSGICVATLDEPETSCTDRCPGFWRRTTSGLFLIQDGLCFISIMGWQWCGADEKVPVQCGCDCT